jgi:hypothetical protein
MSKAMDLPSLRDIEKIIRGSRPRVHPNGFIQVDLDEANRLHVWHPNLRYTRPTFHAIHDHIFNLASKVYSGRLVHVVYDASCEESYGYKVTHQRWQVEACGGPNTILRPTEESPCWLKDVQAYVLQPGDEYKFLAFKLHESLANEPTMTIMTKSDADLTYGANSNGASVMVPLGVIPSDDFNREAYEVNTLWKLIVEAYPS